MGSCCVARNLALRCSVMAGDGGCGIGEEEDSGGGYMCDSG